MCMLKTGTGETTNLKYTLRAGFLLREMAIYTPRAGFPLGEMVVSLTHRIQRLHVLLWRMVPGRRRSSLGVEEAHLRRNSSGGPAR